MEIFQNDLDPVVILGFVGIVIALLLVREVISKF